MRLDWNTLLNDKGIKFPKTLFFELEGTQAFRYGIDEEKRHCLYFEYPPSPLNRLIEPITLSKIQLKEGSFDHRNNLVLTLLDQSLVNQFSDLIINIVTEMLQTSSRHKAVFIRICNDWFELFESANGSLGHQELQGVYAELCFLQYLLLNSDQRFNDILLSWKGPFGKGHDFELNSNCFEIKSTISGAAFLHISSEYQLDYFPEQKLFLIVYQFQHQPVNGGTIKELVTDIYSELKTQTGTRMKLFWSALSKTGLAINNLENYDGHVFQITSTESYNCSSGNFPSLRRQNIEPSIRNIKYDLVLPDLTDYLINNLSAFI